MTGEAGEPMPILEVEWVADEQETMPSGLAGRLADAAGDVFRTAPGRTWARVRRLSSADYAEDGGGPPADVRPVFVRVLKARVPAPEDIENEVERLTRAIADVCGRPTENVHVVYLPAAAGRAAFGGRLVR